MKKYDDTKLFLQKIRNKLTQAGSIISDEKQVHELYHPVFHLCLCEMCIFVSVYSHGPWAF